MTRAEPVLAEFRRRFVDGTLPLLARHGWDRRHGGLVERLTPDLQPDRTPYRRSMLHGRQLFVYSVWGQRLGSREFADNADRVFGHLADGFGDADQGGWFEKTDLDGGVMSADKLLYGHAFVLLGLSAYRHCLGRGVDDQIDRTLDYVTSRFRHGAGLYHTALDRTGHAVGEIVDQNPLMHLLEALLFLSERSQRRDTLGLADEIVERMRCSFLRDGLIVEHLDAGLDPHADHGHLAEPGHQAEWAWLLDWHGRLTGSDRLDDLGRTLLANGIRHGWDRVHGGVFDQIDRRDGRVLAATKRLWPLGELIKAASVFPDGAAQSGLSLEALVGLMCTKYLNHDGTWCERRNRDMTVADATMPASTCYHLSFAVSEALATRRPDEAPGSAA